MKKELMRDPTRKLLGGVVAGGQRAYAPEMDLRLLRVLLAVVTVFVPPLAPVLIVTYLALWAVLPRPEWYCAGV